MYDWIFFDLDGTLTDPFEGISKSVLYALDKENYDKAVDESFLRSFIGPPLIHSFTVTCGFSQERAARAIEEYREYYKQGGILENKVYDGIAPLLARLRESGKRLAVATSKPIDFAKIVLKHFALDGYFDFIGGASMDEVNGDRFTKADVIRYVLDSLEITDTARVLMVGDRLHDVEGARKFGIDTVGVLYGYGSRKELESAGAKYIAPTVEDIEKYTLL